MERKGVYNKRRDGHHGKNLNSYRPYRQYINKWRLPITIVLAFMFVFGVSPIVGERLQVSVLTPNSTSLKYIRKDILNSVKSLTDDCRRLQLVQCAEGGKILISDIVNPQNNVDVLISATIKFRSEYLTAAANKACSFDLYNVLIGLNENKDNVNNFVKKYGNVFDSTKLNENYQKLNTNISELEKFVESCSGQ